MKVITLFATINAGVIAFTPQASPKFATQLSAEKANQDVAKNGRNIVGGAAAFFSGLAVAGQVAFADPGMIIDYQSITDNSNNIVVEKQAYGSSSTLLAGAPSFGGGSSFDTLDFSLPSYSEANGGTAEKSEAPKSAPGFSAGFPELKLPGSGDSESSAPAVDEAEKKAADEASKKAAEEDKAAAKKAAEEDKAAKAKAKEDARIAKEKEAAEKEAAAEKKKAELAVRREAEKQKQEEMVARQRAADEKAKAEAAAQSDEAKVESPKPDPSPAPAPKPAPAPAPKPAPAPVVSAPEVKLPEFAVPEMKIPAFTAPKFEMPSAPAAPKASYDLDIKSPPSAPSVSAPAAPMFAVPALPSFSSDKAETAKVEAQLESQDVRDGRAREKNEKFKSLDDDAKAVEKQAKAARELAKDAKKEAKIAKAEACKTRPGGKALCIRPFGSGY